MRSMSADEVSVLRLALVQFRAKMQREIRRQCASHYDEDAGVFVSSKALSSAFEMAKDLASAAMAERWLRFLDTFGNVFNHPDSYPLPDQLWLDHGAIVQILFSYDLDEAAREVIVGERDNPDMGSMDPGLHAPAAPTAFDKAKEYAASQYPRATVHRLAQKMMTAWPRPSAPKYKEVKERLEHGEIVF